MIRFCLISPHHISLQPRTLREADSLQEKGFQTRLVSRCIDSALVRQDELLTRKRQWRLETVDLVRNGRHFDAWLTESIRAKLCRWMFNRGSKNLSFSFRSYVKGFDRMVKLATDKKAEWFIAHTQAALPIAAFAAKHWGAKLGFDCEDLLAENETDPPEIVRLIEKEFFPRCDYISVPSEQIKNEIMKEYGIRPPVVLYNVFPVDYAEGIVSPVQRPKNSVVRLCWFSQMLGPKRGIEEAIVAIGMLHQKVELHLRGRLSEDYRRTLVELARMNGVETNVRFLPLIDPEHLIKAIGEYDIGLALERVERKNYALTVTNKLFSYLLAGLAVAASDTPGQREIMEKIPSAGFLYPSGDAQALAKGLERLMNNESSLRNAQQAAWEAAREKFCWDLEKEKFLTLFSKNL